MKEQRVLEEWQENLKWRKRQKRQQEIKRRIQKCLIFITIPIIFISVIAIIIIANQKFHNEHFSKGTIINGFDCSDLNVDEAAKYINQELTKQVISCELSNSDYKYFMSGKMFDIQINNIEQLEQFLVSQHQEPENKNFTLDDISLNESKLNEFLSKIPELNGTEEPENAYLRLGDNNLLEIVPEKVGNEIDFDEAFKLAADSLKTKNNSINFSSISMQPEVLSTDATLNQQKDKINSILETSIEYILPDDSSFILDKNIMRNWLSIDADGNYSIDLDLYLESIINEISEKVSSTELSLDFQTTGLGVINLPMGYAKIDFERELIQLKNELGTARAYTRTPIYTNALLEQPKNYVEVDITRQKIWMYVDGECILDSECVTGNVSSEHSTPTGVFHLTYKTTDTYLRGYNDDGTRYNSHVNYWMPFNGNIGFHDATWRNSFGGDLYLETGSHGCVNLPIETAKTIYEHIDKNFLIIIYES